MIGAFKFQFTDVGWRLVHKPAVQIAVRLSFHAIAL
jgi:hypothetical protein